MTDQRKIKAGEAVKDIRSGMTDSELMEKYKISAIGLRQLFKQLLEAKAIQFSELRARNAPYDDAADLDDFRSSLRDQVTFPLTIYEEVNPNNKGMISDISRTGLRIGGVSARTGEVKTFVVSAEHSDLNSPVIFQAVCKWVQAESDSGDSSGFDLVKVLSGNWGDLQILVRSHTDEARIYGLHDDEDATESLDLSRFLIEELTTSGSFSFTGITKTWFGKLVQALPIPALLIDESAKITFANQCWERVAFDHSELLGKPFISLFANSWAAQEAQMIVQRVLSARKPETYQAVLQIEKNRIWGRMHFRSIRMGESRSLLILVEDLTLEREQLVQKQKHEEELRHEIREREKIESALRDSEARYRLIVENTHDLIMVTGADGVISYVSSSCYRVLGWPPEELVGKQPWMIHSDDLDRLRGPLGKVSGTDVEYRIETQDGRMKWVSHSWSPIFSGNQLVSTISILRDVTERKRAEEALQIKESAIASSISGIAICDLSGMLTYVNPAVMKLWRYDRESDLLGKNILELWASQEEAGKAWGATLSAGSWTGELIAKRKDGSSIHLQTATALVKDKTGKAIAIMGSFSDLTERKELEQQFLQAQKMEAIGTLAGGIAHDFNNLLQITMGFSELLLLQKNETDSDYSDLQKINQAARTGRDLVQRLLTFSRKTESNQRTINLNHQIRHVEQIVSRTIPRMIEIELNLEDSPSLINADPGQIEQVIMNLAVNARDAMPEGGKLTIGTESVTLSDQYCRLHGEAVAGPHVLLTISDTGTGMDKETLEHIFDPFFTTKDVGRGTGLGLSVVYGIVRQHGGHISCETGPGKGTTFKVYFPAAEPLDGFSNREVARLTVTGGTETILLVDDEDFILELGQQILQQSGYKALTARTGKEALQIYREQPDAISLVLLDLIMPEMSGKQCISELLKLNPQAKILISSGYALDGASCEAFNLGARGFVSKPFDVAEFLQQVRKTLDSA